jgi:hypothetical protein
MQAEVVKALKKMKMAAGPMGVIAKMFTASEDLGV